MNIPFHSLRARSRCRAFTLVEMLVSVAVLTLLMLMLNQIFSGATTITTLSNKHMDADAQARAVFDRMAIDFASIVKRPDASYWLKDPANTFLTSGTIPGNDQIAFYSQVPGYFLSGTANASPLSLVGYRIFGNQLQRYGTGLGWNGAAGTNAPMIFSGSSTSSGTNAIFNNWPDATSAKAVDSNYESIGPEVFRMEYYYLLSSGTSTNTPWNTAIPSHTSVNGLADVASISVAIAVIDPRSQALVTSSQLSTLAAAMEDFPSGAASGVLEASWESAILTSGLPTPAIGSIRVYRRDFYLPGN